MDYLQLCHVWWYTYSYGISPLANKYWYLSLLCCSLLQASLMTEDARSLRLVATGTIPA